MKTVGIRVPDEAYAKYKSMDSGQRERLYKAMQAVFVSLVEGKLDPNAPASQVSIEVRLCEDRKGKVREAQRAYSHIVEALVSLRNRVDLARELGGTIGTEGVLARLREHLTAVALSLPDQESVDYLKRVHRVYLSVLEAHAKERRVGVERLKELIDALKEMKAYLEDRYPVF